jgi:hypothetical protein
VLYRPCAADVVLRLLHKVEAFAGMLVRIIPSIARDQICGQIAEDFRKVKREPRLRQSERCCAELCSSLGIASKKLDLRKKHRSPGCVILAASPVPPELLYPSLYAEHSLLVQHCGAYFRSIVITLGRRRGEHATHTSRFTCSAEQ